MPAATAIRRAMPAATALLTVVLAACTGGREAPPIDDLAWQKELEAQFSGLAALRTGPTGPLSWVGLWALPEGGTSFGSGPGASIRITGAGIPPMAGTFQHVGADVLVESAPGVTLRLEDGTPVTGPMKLESDATPRPTVLAFGDVRLKVHEEPGTTRRWIRGSNPAAPAIAAYAAPARFP
nr:hypothetical protein [Gemmatimonadaceae bacterium]